MLFFRIVYIHYLIYASFDLLKEDLFEKKEQDEIGPQALMDGLPVEGYGDADEKVAERLSWKISVSSGLTSRHKAVCFRDKRMREIQDEYSVPSSIQKSSCNVV
ncbi:hypothetical protein ACEQPO_08580 [Bacillus sp. SL00103]